jgi:hypothetical protein
MDIRYVGSGNELDLMNSSIARADGVIPEAATRGGDPTGGTTGPWPDSDAVRLVRGLAQGLGEWTVNDREHSRIL